MRALSERRVSSPGALQFAAGPTLPLLDIGLGVGKNNKVCCKEYIYLRHGKAREYVLMSAVPKGPCICNSPSCMHNIHARM